MPIVECSGCGKKLRVPDENIGKRMKCPGCGFLFKVPGVGGDKSRPVAPRPSAFGPEQETDQWYMKTPDGKEFGPVPKTELEDWIAEDRLTTESQLLLKGSEEWQWASDVFPVLTQRETPAGDELPSMISITTDEQSRSKRHSPFRPRQYPAMMVYRTILLVCGWIIIVDGVLGVGFIVTTTIKGVATIDDELGKFAILGFGVLFGVLSALLHAILVVFLWFLAEGIKMAIDIQDNTHKTSHYLKELASRR